MVKMKIQKENARVNLLLAGVLAGFIPTALSLTFNLRLRYSVLGLVIGITITLVLIAFFWFLWESDKTIKKITHKARLVFFGISLISFALAIVELVTFLRTPSSFAFGEYDFIIEGISLRDFFMNFAIGGFFSVLERYFDLREKGEVY